MKRLILTFAAVLVHALTTESSQWSNCTDGCNEKAPSRTTFLACCSLKKRLGRNCQFYTKDDCSCKIPVNDVVSNISLSEIEKCYRSVGLEPQPPYVCKWQFILRDGDDTAKIRCSTFRLGRERGDCRDGACACEQSHVKSRSYLQIRGNITKPIADKCEKDVYSDRCAECKVNKACDYDDCKGSSRVYCGNPRGGKLNIELASRKGRGESLIKVEVFVKEGETPELCCVYSRSILVKFLSTSLQLAPKTVLILHVEIDALLTSGRCSRDLRINCFFKDYVDVSDCNLIPNCDEFIRRVLESLGSVSGDGPSGDEVEEHKPTATTVTELLTSAPPTEPSETATPETEKTTNKESKRKDKDKKKKDKKKDKKDKKKKREREG